MEDRDEMNKYRNFKSTTELKGTLTVDVPSKSHLFELEFQVYHGVKRNIDR